MKKIKTAFFLKQFLFTTAGYLIVSVFLNLFLKENLYSEFWVEAFIQGVSFGLIMAFMTNPKSKRTTDFNEVK